jgi:hypothetical protein
MTVTQDIEPGLDVKFPPGNIVIKIFSAHLNISGLTPKVRNLLVLS